MKEEEGMLTKGRKGGTRGEGEYGGRKRKARRGEMKNVVRHLIETKCVGTNSALAGERCHRSHTARRDERHCLSAYSRRDCLPFV